MKRLSIFWKVICSVMAISLAGIFGLEAWMYYRDYQRVDLVEKRTFSENCVGLRFSDDNYYIKNLKEGQVTINNLDWAVAPRGKDSLGVFSKEQKRGYFNIYTGEAAIPARYEKAWIFSEGLAGVMREGKIGFIDEKGATVIPFQYPYFSEYARKTDFVFRNGTCAMYDSTGKCGLIDKRGDWMLSARYDYINKPVAGFRIFKDDGQFGVLGDSLQVLLPPCYDWIDILTTGFVVRGKDNSQQLIAYDGKTTLNPLIYYTIEPLSYADGYDENGNEMQKQSEYMAYRVWNSYGLMDKNGHPVTRPLYSLIRALPNNLFYCDLENPEYSVVINNKGELVE